MKSLRPFTLRQVAEKSDSLEAFGRNFQDWLHALRSWSSRPQVAAAIAAAPPRLARRWRDGALADAWLAAYAEYVAGKIGRPVPSWAWSVPAVAEPWFAEPGQNTRSRLAALRDSPGPFKARNLYTSAPNLPLRLAAGRPAKTLAELREANAKRQQRFRARRRLEWLRLKANGVGS